MSETRAVRAGGIRLVYEVSGPSDGAALLLLHARGEGRGDWAPVAARLAESWRVYVPDLRGHGESDWPGEYSFELMCDDVAGFLAALGLTRVSVIGHSMGAVVAFLLAERDPGLVDRLVLEEPPVPLPPARPLDVPARPAGALGFDWALVPATTAERNDPDPRWWERLTDITAETLVIAGGPESHLPQDDLRELTNRIPQARMVTIPAGHLVHAAEPAAFLDEVTPFLDDRPA